jgi:hypothetical protein
VATPARGPVAVDQNLASTLGPVSDGAFFFASCTWRDVAHRRGNALGPEATRAYSLALFLSGSLPAGARDGSFVNQCPQLRR